MAIFKCKMCGGTLKINSNESVVECEYCGTQQTLPKLNDKRKENLYDRANHFRRNNEFDKAEGIYEQILNEDNTDAEAYWSLVLCRYGIEYVEDPTTHKRVPTVNRAQFTSVFDDDNYKSALQYADLSQKVIYEKEAKSINEIQKDILAISQKEEPFDVFICYKETDNSGRRTPDSVLANDLYHQLTQEGFKVFFSRITLEDKLGSAYEPYIFAALNSAKVMVVLGTKPEYFKAVWVRNEWSRYLSLIKQGHNKMLIPSYRDMDPYDLPEEFSHLQAQDMSKLGFMQDLIRGIKKITKMEQPNATVVKETVIAGSNLNTAPLLKRAFMFLEDGDWDSADEYCEKVLDVDPECAEAYLGKLLSELRVRKQEALKEQAEIFDDSNNYQKVVRFADEKLKREIAGYIEYINTRNKKTRIDSIYIRAKNTMSDARTENAYKEAARLFESISEYQDSAALARSCCEKAEVARKDAVLSEGKSKMFGEIISNYETAIKLFETISGWMDADEQIIACQRKIEEIKAKEEDERKETERIEKRNKKIVIIATSVVCAIVAFIIVLNSVVILNGKYNDAILLMDAGKYSEARAAFEGLKGYKDSVDKIEECNVGIYGEEVWNKFKSVNVGDTYIFGSYEQDNNKSNGQEDIEWLVLEKEENRILVISKYSLDCKPYHTNYIDVTWETCFLRKWMNNDFINAAFSDDEKAMIPTVTVSDDNNPTYNSNPGKETQDQVFLLSVVEVKHYLRSDSERKCRTTDYTVVNGAWKSDSGNCRWWLRSPGYEQDYAADVADNGYVNDYGYAVDENKAVRPALWIDLNF